MGAYAGFFLKKREEVVIKIGTSFSSLEGARKNLQAEIGNRNFNDIKKSAEKVWEEALSKIKVSTNNEQDKKILYTAMYHTMELPRLYNYIDGTYPKFSGIYELMNSRKDYCDDFSMWDIFRAQLPLQELLRPAKDL